MLCIGAFFQSFADNVGIDAAKDKAAQFLMERSGNVLHSQSRTPVQTVPELEIAHVEMAQGDALYYVFDKGQDDGFIVVSAEDRTPAVLCYVDEGKFELDNMAPAAREMFAQYSDYISRVRKGLADPVARLSVQKPIYPMLRSRWGQSYPYDMKCPGVTGCVATALAQIMYYYKWPETAEGSYSYLNEINGETLSVEYGCTYHYDWMLADCLYSEDENMLDAVSTLLYHVGVACDMQYGPDESFAFLEVAVEGIKRHFKYDSNARVDYAANYENPVWEAMIYDELAEGRPVVYMGVEESYGGHAFVLDGYDDGYFHVNWGWNGVSDGYYLLTSMMGFANLQSACLNLKPIDHEASDQTSDGLFRWGYCDDAICPCWGGEGTVGGAIYIPYSFLKAYQGKTITGVEIGLGAETEDFECFISKSCTSDPIWCNLDDVIEIELSRKSTGIGTLGWNKVMFDEPVAIDDAIGYFVGYTATNTTNSYPGAVSMHEQWNDSTMYYSGIFLSGGIWFWDPTSSACIRLLMNDEDMPYDIRMLKVEDMECSDSDSVSDMKFTVENMSPVRIENFTIAYQIGKGDILYSQIEAGLEPHEIARYSIPVKINRSGIYDLRVWIENVDGMADAVNSNSNFYRNHPIQLVKKGRKFFRRNVMESYISTNCVFSANAISADNHFSESYSENYIGINVHQDLDGPDPMSLPDNYDWQIVLPTTKINRIEYSNSTSNLENDLLNFTYADFDISMQAVFTDEDRDSVCIITSIIPGYDVDGREYRIAYAVTEDSVGPYTQCCYADEKPFEYVWNDGDAIVFNRVARGIYSTLQGYYNSLPKTMTAGTTYQHSQCIGLPLNIDNVSNISIVAMLVNQSTGVIENAFSLRPMPSADGRIAFREKAVDLETGKSVVLKTISYGLPDDAKLVWTSSNPDLVTISDSGTVNAGMKEGRVTITVQVKDRPEIMASCEVFIIKHTEVAVLQPGTLAVLISDNMYECVKVKISGSLNGDDLITLRRMAGGEIGEDGNRSGCLEVLDLSNARFVKGGAPYFLSYTIDNDDIIPDCAFQDCITLKEVICPSSCKEIGWSAFFLCSSLESVILNEGLLCIGSNVFSQTQIPVLNLPSSLLSFSNNYSTNRVSTINLADGNEAFVCVDNVLYDKKMERLVFYPSCKREKIFNAISLKHVSDNTGGFSFNTHLCRLYLDGIEDLELNANAFDFAYFGRNLKSVERSLFWNNTDLDTLLCAAVEPPVFTGTDEYPLSGHEECFGRMILYVPRSGINAYKSAEVWNMFENILPIEDYSGDSIYNKIQALHNTCFTVSYCIGDSVVHQDQVLYCDTIPEYAYEPQKEGYTFSGWSEIPATMPANDVVVNGTFRVNNYLLTYVVDDVIYQSDTLEYGSEIIPAEAPNAAGKTFMGWENLPASMPAENIQVIGHLYSLLTGDANNDTEVNVGDFSSTVNYILERPAPGFVKLMADVDSNEDINVADVVGITNIILDYDYPSMAIGRSPNRESDVIDNFNLTQIAETEHDIIISLNMSSQKMFTAFQLDIDLPKGMVIKAARLSDNKDNSHMVSFGKLSNGEWRVISASLNGKQLKTDEVSLLILELERTEEDDSMLISVHDALFSDRNLNITEAVDCSLLLSGNPTCIKKIIVDDSEPVYNINGTKLTGDVSNGLFIINGKKVLKHE